MSGFLMNGERRWMPPNEYISEPKERELPNLHIPFPLPVFRDVFMILFGFAFGSVLECLGWIMVLLEGSKTLTALQFFGGTLCIIGALPLGCAIGSGISYLLFRNR